MITNACNLQCSYCFANKFVNHDAKEISLDNFRRVVDFITKDGFFKKVGLIGGEPTLHSHFVEILRFIIGDERIESSMLYTNGVYLDNFIGELSHRKFFMLINCNSPDDIGAYAFEKYRSNIALLVNKFYMRDRITLGLNIYNQDMDFSYILDLLKEFAFHRVRVSITVPNVIMKQTVNAHQYFLSIKDTVKRLFIMLLRNDIIPFYDCNKMPSCCIMPEDAREIAGLVKNSLSFEKLKGREDVSINTPIVHCAPVIDIMQDMTAVRCFGLSEYTRVSISDFRNAAELRNYYMGSIDCFAHSVSYSRKCASCRHRKNLECTGGCLAFKIPEIVALREFAFDKMKSHKDILP